VQESHVPVCQRRANVGFRDTVAEINAQIEGALRFERRLGCGGLSHDASPLTMLRT